MNACYNYYMLACYFFLQEINSLWHDRDVASLDYSGRQMHTIIPYSVKQHNSCVREPIQRSCIIVIAVKYRILTFVMLPGFSAELYVPLRVKFVHTISMKTIREISQRKEQ